MTATKLQKLMAQAGHGSRRACEQIIREGRVTVNGERARLGLRADPQTDEIQVDGKPLDPAEPETYVLLHKPAGVLCSARSQGGWPTVTELVESTVRLYPVGRLDLQSEGLVLMTNDGTLAHQLTHPSWGHEKEYRVLLDRIPSEDQLRHWRSGLTLLDARHTAPAEAWLEPGPAPGPWLRVVLKQGMKRQIRMTAESLGLKVRRIVRIRIGPLMLGDLAPGTWRELSDQEKILLNSDGER